MHGRADGSGVLKGNTNALKHGRYSAEAIRQCRALRELLRQARAKLAGI
jgi:glucans biosynthesis protein